MDDTRQPLLLRGALPRTINVLLQLFLFLLLSFACSIVMFLANVCVFDTLPIGAFPNVLSIIIFSMAFGTITMYFLR